MPAVWVFINANQHVQQEIQEQIRLMESHVAGLRTQNLTPHLIIENDPILRLLAVELAVLLYTKQAQQLHVAKMQSAFTRCLVRMWSPSPVKMLMYRGTLTSQIDQPYYPLYRHICLTKDWDERRATLLAMREEKLRNAYDFVMSPVHRIESDKAQFSESRIESEHGDLCCVVLTRCTSQELPLEQVFDAFSFFMTNMEIVIFEQLGHAMHAS
ncbi:unnamed protein product [Phytophthora lilii]|uniref:Unnamed protein product n=1 Tax=Phytophthora lilii TaxID=2077276 RepID=A0A9W6TQN6_9STRA|nr:unnamed protein product [Phytophthora lilii]